MIWKRGYEMEKLLDFGLKWADLKEYLEIYGDFVLKEPKVTDEVIRETEEVINESMESSPYKDISAAEVKRIFNEKMSKRVIYDDGEQRDMAKAQKLEDISYEDFKIEPIDDKIKEAIVQMANLYRQRRNYEYTFGT